MSKIYLQSMVSAIPDDRLPMNWVNFDLAQFSAQKRLWDYQQNALKNALKTLWKYYEEFQDYQPNEDDSANQTRKAKLWGWYRDNGYGKDADIKVPEKYDLARLLEEYYEPLNGTIPYEQFISRMSFWMATGSGKTLVIVKLIELLARLTRLSELPPHDILFLTHRDDLIEQLRRHVDEFNQARSDFHIHLRELKEYNDIKRGSLSLFHEKEVTVFYYRSDNLSDEQKEKIVDYRNYDNNGRWFILLDEAHKGDREDSKRQHIYSILSRNGFLFNFSATFTDPRDIATTVFNFNLAEYIREGYGKHLLVLQQEMRAFKDKEDFNDQEKQKMVLKTLMVLAYVRKVYESLRRNDVYHRPMMLVLVNSVNTEDADLKLFFRQLETIASQGVSQTLWDEAKSELEKELCQPPTFFFENEQAQLLRSLWGSLSFQDLLEQVFNASDKGAIEVQVRPSNKQEMVFKLKTSDKPFALIKIGDISGWLKEELSGYEIMERFEDESYFARLNSDDFDINILMGSRSFYEGWDSNRPNVICYINIGTGTDARKFVLQSVGRGVRIEPLKNKRRRLQFLYNAGELDQSLYNQLKDKAQPLETLFIFGTNRTALATVIQELEKERVQKEERLLDSFEINPLIAQQNAVLLIPQYKQASVPLAKVSAPVRFEVSQDELSAMQAFVQKTDPRVLLALYNADPLQIKTLCDTLANPNTYYHTNGRHYGSVRRAIQFAMRHWSVVPEEFDHLKEIGDEIRHYKHITVTLKDIAELEYKIKRIKKYQNVIQERKALFYEVQNKIIDYEEYERRMNELSALQKDEIFYHDLKTLLIKHIAEHYYLPVILSEDEKVDYIRHIIKTPSEVKFIKELERYLEEADNKFNCFDWWFFSKIDESLDEVYIPYYDPKTNRIARFKPDFIFWFKRGNRYWIVFVDPKGTEHTDYQRKIDGYRALFHQNDAPCTLSHCGFQVEVHLYMYQQKEKVPEGYRGFAVSTIAELLEKIGAKCDEKPVSSGGVTYETKKRAKKKS